MSFLAAAAFHAMPDLPVAVDLFGTPDEELHGGKVPMCEQGVFKDYDLVLMVHMSSCETTPNSRFLALDDYRVRFHGQTAHAAAHPWEGRNALNGATLSLHAIDMLRQHVLPDTRIGMYIVNGGTASNVIPDFAELECCIRHTTRTYLDQVVKRIMNCFAGAALATETTYEVEQVGYKYDDLIWNETATEVVRQVLREMKIPFVEPGIGGSSDIANISHQCRCFISIWPWAIPSIRTIPGKLPTWSKARRSNRSSSREQKSLAGPFCALLLTRLLKKRFVQNSTSQKNRT